MSVTRTILKAVDRHEQLVSSLDRAQAARSKLDDVTAQISDLEETHRQSKFQLDTIKTRTKEAWGQLASLKDSTRTKLTYRLMGRNERLDELTREGERRYMEAVTAEQRIHAGHAHTEQLLTEAQAYQTRLRVEVDQLPNIRIELERLYESIFKGPTPEYMEEDAAEDKLEMALVALTDLQTRLAAEQRAYKCLTSALKKTEGVTEEMEDAKLISGTLPYRQLRIEKLRTSVVEIQALVLRAQVAQPLLKVMDDLDLPIDSWALVFPYNFPERCEFADRNHVRTKLGTAWTKLKSHTITQKSWINSLKGELEAAGNEVKEAREELFRLRRAIFERVVQTDGDLPPKYEL